jgi:microcompartment protein CcmL/EutN
MKWKTDKWLEDEIPKIEEKVKKILKNEYDDKTEIITIKKKNLLQATSLLEDDIELMVIGEAKSKEGTYYKIYADNKLTYIRCFVILK